MKFELDPVIKELLRLMAADCQLDDEAKARLYSRIFGSGKAGDGNEQN